MTGPHPSRRQFVAAAIAGTCGSVLPRPLIAQGAQPRIVVIGGGFAGATAARFLKRTDPRLDVTLVEPNPIFSACPFSN
ncbi:MAG TPA: FAD-dependent oxidoreductase, partial [Xanthobacteraceae bacterium]|nr:FAD-dependent oxidoreductase [Xanthobacteraceae bacterium]